MCNARKFLIWRLDVVKTDVWQWIRRYMTKHLWVLLLCVVVGGCADWNAFIQCKYAVFQPCPPQKVKNDK